MPVYNYKCKVCGKEHESFEKMDTKKIKCTCGNDADKVPSLSNFHLKGGGWYKDGYGNKKWNVEPNYR